MSRTAAGAAEPGRSALAHGALEDARTCFEAAVTEDETAQALEGLSYESSVTP